MGRTFWKRGGIVHGLGYISDGNAELILFSENNRYEGEPFM